MPVKLAPQPFSVLAMLVLRRGELVTRDEIRTELWGDGTIVEFDQGLNYCIRQIRLILDDDAREPRFIETVPKRGYRFMVPVTSEPSEPVAAVASESTDRPRAINRREFGLAALGGVSAIGAAFIWKSQMQSPRPVVHLDEETSNLYVEAVHYGDLWEGPSLGKSIEVFHEVIRRAPEFPQAHAGLSIVLAQYSAEGKELPESESEARQALRLDPALALAHTALAHCCWHQWRWEEADGEFRKALGYDREDAVSHQLYGMYLAALGKTEEAVYHGVRATKIEPASALKSSSLAKVYYETRQFELAVKQEKKTLELSPGFKQSYGRLARLYSRIGTPAEAEDAFRDSRSSSNFSPMTRAAWLARNGRRQEAQTMVDEFRNRPDANLGTTPYAVAAATLGDLPAAFEAMNRAVDRHAGDLIWVKSNPELDPLRPDPRFARVLARVNL